MTGSGVAGQGLLVQGVGDDLPQRVDDGPVLQDLLDVQVELPYRRKGHGRDDRRDL